MRARALRVTAAAVALAAAVLPAAAFPPPAVSETRPAASHGAGDGCDPIDPAACLLPFPSDWYTVRDRSTPTGRRVHMTTTLTNALGRPVRPDEWNRADGFSPGSALLTHVPGVDLARSGAAPITDIGASLRGNAPIVIVDTATGERWPYWAELDAQAGRPDRQALIVRPARNFREGHRYVVALRDLKDAAGARIAPDATFAKLLGRNLPARDPLHDRQKATREVLRDLSRHGIGRDGLNLAWDFTVASRESIAGRMLHIRDDALDRLGRSSPPFQVTQVTDDVDARIGREVKGLLQVPSYLDLPGGPPGSKFHYGRDGKPARLPDKVPYWGIPAIRSYPYDGSALVIWDSGSPAPPLSNIAPTEGRDPHSHPRSNPEARRQKAVFLSTGEVIDVCGGGPCVITP